MEQIRLLAPDTRGLPEVRDLARLTAEQQAAVRTFASGADVIVHGAPGSGRTALALTAAAGHDALLLAPRRTSAASLRDALAVHGSSAARAMTPPALAHAVLRAEAIARGLGEPTLVTGADQDALLAELIEERSTWHLEIDPAARTLPGFRTELRDLITRATELGMGPADLDRLGRERNKPAWRDAAAILRDYLGVLDLEAAAALDAGPRLDSGGLVRRAARLLEQPGAELPASCIIVDDAQDLTTAGIALVLALAAAGARVLVTSCPDEAVDTFRGAVPDAAAQLRRRLPRTAAEITLTAVHDTATGITAVADALRARLPLAGAPAAVRRPRLAPVPAVTEEPAVAVLRAADPLEEARLIADVLRDLHHREQIPYDDMAIVCRSGAAVTELADLLARTGMPVRTPRRPRPLREEPVIADLLTIVEIGMAEIGADGDLDPLIADELLRGPFGDADTLRLRRIRRMLLGAQGGEEPSDRLLARALVAAEDDEIVATLPAATARDRVTAPVHRIRAMITAVREHRAGTAQDVLWQAWNASGLATGWRRAALGDAADVDGARSRLAAGRLDALLELFAAAERLADRRPGSDALDLVRQVRSQAVAEDTLAPAATPRGRIAVLTPAQLAGEHRDTVVLAHLQEGAWPNLRLRSTLFGAGELALPAADPEELRAMQRSQVIADELRLAVSAVTRARRRVLVTAVDGDDLEPSALVEAIEQASSGSWVDERIVHGDPGPAPDLRQLVASLRRRLRSEDPRRAEDAAAALRALAEAGAPGADPDQWYHQQPSTLDALHPLREDDTMIALSPSALERAADCPQAWLMERAGGTRSAGPAQAIGTALHRLAQEHPRGADPSDLLAELHTLLRAVPGLETWSGRRRVRRAEDAARLLAEHLAGAAEPLAVEAAFDVTVGEDRSDGPAVRLRGSIDRIEGDRDGLRVVDLKTGRAAKTAAKAEEDLQLAAYQTAIREGALDEHLGEDAAERLTGAQLVYIGTGGRKAAIRTQAAHPAWFDDVVAEVARDVSGSRVIARINPHCSLCAVRSSCPLQPEGEQL